MKNASSIWKRLGWGFKSVRSYSMKNISDAVLTDMTNHARSNGRSLESWIWDGACSIRGAKDAPKCKDDILPLIFTKCLCDVFDAELNRIAAEVGEAHAALKETLRRIGI